MDNITNIFFELDINNPTNLDNTTNLNDVIPTTIPDSIWHKLPDELNLSKYLISKSGEIINPYGQMLTPTKQRSGYV